MNNAEQKRLMRQTMKARLRKYKSGLRDEVRIRLERDAAQCKEKVDALYRDLEIRDALLDQRRSDLAAYQETIRKIAEVLASTGYSTDRGFLWDDVRRMAADAKRWRYVRKQLTWAPGDDDGELKLVMWLRMADPDISGTLTDESVPLQFDAAVDAAIARGEG